MEAKYRFGHRPGRRRRARIAIICSITLVIVGLVSTVVFFDLRKGQSKPVEGTSRQVIQVSDESTEGITVDGATFSLRLPSDWKQTDRVQNLYEDSVTWQATKANQNNRSLQIFVDRIPKQYAVNHMLPVTAHNDGVQTGDVSNNCASFTNGTLEDRGNETGLAKWEGIDFLCDLGNTIDNRVGTSSTDGIDKVNVTGPTKGVHTYFFLYIDRNIQPDNTIFYDALKSFKAK